MNIGRGGFKVVYSGYKLWQKECWPHN